MSRVVRLHPRLFLEFEFIFLSSAQHLLLVLSRAQITIILTASRLVKPSSID
jgi:hypothetical protein